MMENFERLLEITHSYEDLCIMFRHHGGQCYEDNNLSLLIWPPTAKGHQPPHWRGKPIKSIVINPSTMTPVMIGSPYVLFDDYCTITNACIDQLPMKITELYDAREITLFHHNGQWVTMSGNNFHLDFVSTWSEKNRLVRELWEESLHMSVKDFTSKHDPNYIYIYLLLHHEDRHVIDYTRDLGNGYKYVLLHSMRSVSRLDLLPELIIPQGVKVITPLVHKDFSSLDYQNQDDEEVCSLMDVIQAGVHVSIGETWIHLHTSSFKLYNETSDTSVKPCCSEHYLGLYQRNSMDSYLTKFKSESFHTGPDGTPYQIKGLIDSVFKVFTSEVLYLFKMLWDVRFGTAKEDYKDVYLILPSEYKKVFYVLRGIYFSKKVSTSTVNRFVTIKTVYDMLKRMEPSSLVKLIVERQKILACPSQYKRLYDLLVDYHQNDHLNRASKVIEQAMCFIEKNACI